LQRVRPLSLSVFTYCSRHTPTLGLAGLWLLAGAFEAQAASVSYTTIIEGASAAGLNERLRSLSESIQDEDDPPASLIHLRRRALRDQERFLEVLRAEGYFDAAVEFRIAGEQEPAALTFTAEPGPRYTLGPVELDFRNDRGSDKPRLPKDVLPIQAGQPARSAPIKEAHSAILDHLRRRGYPFPKLAERRVVVDHDHRTVTVTFVVDPGPAAQFGEVIMTGLKSVKEQVVRQALPWEPGDDYNQEQLDEARRELYDLGLFSTARVSLAARAVGEDGRVPVSVDVSERKHQTVAAGAEFRTDEGPAVQARWEHRNIQGLGRDLSLSVILGTELRDALVRYRLNRFRREDQSLTLSADIAQEEREAFDSDHVELAGVLDRRLSETLTVGTGLAIRISETEQLGESETHQLLYSPNKLAWDRSNDRLDPTRGFRLTTRWAPYVDPFGELVAFLKTDVTVSHYWPLAERPGPEGNPQDDWIIATRLKLGALVGEGLFDVPADLRFYAGGGGSIRGFPFETVSPLDRNDPIGGRSLVEVSFEVRKKITHEIGVVAFVDGGSAFESTFPDFGETLRWGAGVGLRYHTPLGPLRLDVATPINRREAIDERVQVYLSIGQAF